MMHLIKYPLDETVNRFFEEAAAKGFEMRDGQMEMANDICKAITKKRPLAVEAEVAIQEVRNGTAEIRDAIRWIIV